MSKETQSSQLNLSQKEQRVQSLPEKERVLYENWVNQGGASLASKTALQFFELYLQGYSVEEIAKQNPPFDPGLIVKAKVDFDWDTKRQEYITQLQESVHQAVQKVSLETVQFASDAIAVYHKLAGAKFKKYLRTGDEADLGHFAGMSVKAYKDFLEILLKMTGQSNTSKQEVSVTHTIVDNQKTIDAKVTRPLTPQDASLLIDELSKEEKS